jgi:hypothetical protein
MPRSPDSGQLDLSDVFLKVQQELLAQMAVGGLFEHASAAGTATEPAATPRAEAAAFLLVALKILLTPADRRRYLL